ncbi:MAG: hypothetical protein U9N49_11785 [Campylobacterota bacterium]|nr:hypothetical protein [Campylobacterota bacterium]
MKRTYIGVLFVVLFTLSSADIHLSQIKNSDSSRGLIKEDKNVGELIYRDILEDKELLSFIQEIKASVKSHNWSAFIGLCLEKHYKVQVGENQMSTVQYIAEAMGLHNQGNSIFESGESLVDMKVLEKIEEIKILSIKKHYNEVHLEGIVILKSGKKLKMNMELLYDTQDGYMISGALG